MPSTSAFHRIATLSADRRREITEKILTQVDAAELPDEVWLLFAPFSLISASDRARLPPDVVDAYPLTTSQLAMVAHMLDAGPETDGLRPPNPYHNVATSYLRLRSFSTQAFTEAATRLITRHEIFRTSFSLYDYSEPIQLVHASAVPFVRFYDLTAADERQQHAAMQEFADEANHTLVALDQQPLMHFHVHLLAHDRIALTLVEPHAISDGWSTHLSLVELLNYHNAIVRGRDERVLPPLRTSFRHYVAQQIAELRSVVDREYWTRHAGRYRSSVSSPRYSPDGGQSSSASSTTSRASTRSTASSGHRQSTSIDKDLVRSLRAVARNLNVDLRTVLLAAHLRALGAIEGAATVNTGVTVNGRLAVEDGTEVRGMFLNIIPITIHLPPTNWARFIKDVQATEREHLQHRRYPLAAIGRTAGPAALPTSMFVYNHFHSIAGVAKDIEIETLEDFADWSRTNYALEASFNLSAEHSDELSLLLVVDPTRFDTTKIKPAIATYLDTLADIVHKREHPAETPGTTPVDTGITLLAELDQCVRELAKNRPDAIAVTDSQRSMTYAEYNQATAAVAAGLHAAGFGVGSKVGVLCDPSVDSVVVAMGILRAGAVYVPMDPQHPTTRHRFIIDDAGVEVVISDNRASHAPHARTISVDDLRSPVDAPAALPHVPPLRDLPHSRPVYIMYTSGSSGKPKGVALTYAGLLNRLSWMQDDLRLGPDDVLLHKTSASFDVSIWELFWAQTVGAQLVVADAARVQEPHYLTDLIGSAGVTVCHFVPTMLRRFLTEEHEKSRDSLRAVVSSGEVLSPGLARLFYEKYPSADLVNMYGPTECTIDVTRWFVARGDHSTAVPIGRAAPSCDVFVADRDLNELPDGTEGEICIGGVQVADGYIGLPELTAAKFRRRAGGTRVYRTGDIGRRSPDGILEYLGRTDRQVKIRGVRVELDEVEHVLESHPAVVAAVVERIEDLDEPATLTAFIQVDHDLDAPPHLAEWLAQRLPRAMCPTRIHVVAEIPTMPNGKTDRRALLDKRFRAVVDGSRRSTPPVDTVEEILAKIWSELTGVENIDMHADLSSMGMDSLIAVMVIGRLREHGFLLKPMDITKSKNLKELRTHLVPKPNTDIRTKKEDGG